MKVLDVGGSLHFWEMAGSILRPEDLTILNIAADGQSLGDTIDIEDRRNRIILYDGRNMPFPDQSFDIVICNSVIEHVPPQQRKMFASEIERVGRSYVVQTPAYEFPLEPHFVAPFIHWLPRRLGRRLSSVTPYGIATRGQGPKMFDEVNLLRRSSISATFPRARIVVERFAGLPKSYLAYRKDNID